MKTQISKLARIISVLGLACLVTGPRASAQAGPELELKLYAGLTITGAVGTVYAIQATTDVAQTNGWTCLTFLRLQTTNFLWLDPTAPATERRFYRAVATAPTNLVFIPPGTFRMGSPTNEVDRFDDEGPQTEVTLTKGFYMAKYPVTEAEYLAVVGSNPESGWNSGPSHPVCLVNWLEATNYCAKRTQQEAAAGLIPARSKYRLPTEAEWEYACRAWTSTRFYYGEDPGYTNLTHYAWYSDNTADTPTHPVGQKLPNTWGLYDMAGLVPEWCQDRYGLYPGGSVSDPQGPSSGPYYVARGALSTFDASRRRSAYRNWYGLTCCTYRFHFGFRVVLATDQP